jgi:hypothetical protein
MRRIVENPGILETFRTGIPPVKTIAANAAELEVLYRQAIAGLGGLRDEVPSDGRLPLLELWGRSYSGRRGRVRRQGEDLVLLEPGPKGGSAVRYEIDGSVLPEGVRLEIETELLKGETSVVLGGAVFLDGRPLGVIPLHAYERGGEMRMRHRFPCRLPRGASTLEISNRHPGGTGRDPHLRIKRILLYRGGGVGAGGTG